MWKSLFVALVIAAVLLQVVYAYSRFGNQEGREKAISGGGHDSINRRILSGSNIHYYGRFRSGQDDVLNRYFQRLL
ncbi:hypothetical protein OESDEN_02051 [Oesophagostomum dentatum]|uniref:Uncharacterized protein n=1 Tax=Oesophagostomum dentatum TaxID=61180 RepID=A0A0B1TK89_OESDE|nr:hypothetical protein OESDEN_02051 [Oesophagostomum dentatum]